MRRSVSSQNLLKWATPVVIGALVIIFVRRNQHSKQLQYDLSLRQVDLGRSTGKFNNLWDHAEMESLSFGGGGGRVSSHAVDVHRLTKASGHSSAQYQKSVGETHRTGTKKAGSPHRSEHLIERNGATRRKERLTTEQARARQSRARLTVPAVRRELHVSTAATTAPATSPTPAIATTTVARTDAPALYGDLPAPRFFREDYLQLYLRLNYAKGWGESRSMILPSLQLFWPHIHVLVVLDGDFPADQQGVKGMSERVAQEFPPLHVRGVLADEHPEMSGVAGYAGWQRGQLDMMFADRIVKAKYVGLCDSDATFVTLVTPSTIFTEDGRPIIHGSYGRQESLWNNAVINVQYILKKDYVMSCMSYFPVVIKTAHIAAMRDYIRKIHGKPFIQVYKEMVQGRNFYCHYSTMCNYVWYFHRDEYEFRFQNYHKGKPDWNNPLQGQTRDFSFLTEENRRPYVAVTTHLTHTNINREYDLPYGDFMQGGGIVGHLGMYDPSISDRWLVQGFCYVAIAQCRSEDECKKLRDACASLNVADNKLQFLLFRFEILQSWEWDTRCLDAQKSFYKSLKHYPYWTSYGKKVLSQKNSQVYRTLNL